MINPIIDALDQTEEDNFIFSNSIYPSFTMFDSPLNSILDVAVEKSEV